MTYYKRRVIILTSDSMRHKFFYSRLINEKSIKVEACFSEKTKSSKDSLYVDFDNIKSIHFNERARVEEDFFKDYVKDNFNPDMWHSIGRGDINKKEFIGKLKKINPDLILCYGCSIISENVIEEFRNKILNVHLGLSPYYLGSATNFHPLVCEKPELIGYTLMYIDKGIDTGRIIHQARPRINIYDNSHHVGCKIIKDMTATYINLVKNFSKIEEKEQPSFENSIVCMRKDTTVETVNKMYLNLKNGMFLRYLKEKKRRDALHPIIQQSVLL